jgi:hypothetical protein
VRKKVTKKGVSSFQTRKETERAVEEEVKSKG